jgi:UDP-glucose 4-epimerase
MSRGADILVIGGGSRIAGALLDRLGPCARSVARSHTGRVGELLVEDYAEIPSAAFEGVNAVVNCVGAVQGDAALLDRVNITIPLRLAERARQARARSFIHVSSFSVYGSAERIDRQTPAAPVSDYGRSKLASDERLLTMATPGFDVTILRLPLVYSMDSLGKLGTLLRLWKRLRVLPVPVSDVRRAMIGVDLSAHVIVHLLASAPRTSVAFAADPQPFTYRDTAEARSETLYRLPVPSAFIALAAAAFPAAGRRLFADSDLADADNLVLRYGLTSNLYRDIAAAVL